MSEPRIGVGQVWRRKKDGVLVEVTRFDGYWLDVYWRSEVDGVKRRGVCFVGNFRKGYEFEPSP